MAPRNPARASFKRGLPAPRTPRKFAPHTRVVLKVGLPISNGPKAGDIGMIEGFEYSKKGGWVYRVRMQNKTRSTTLVFAFESNLRKARKG